MQERLDLGDELLREIFQLRTETGLHALPGPDQLFAERRQFRAFAALGFDQRHAKKSGPLLDQIPDGTVGKAGVSSAGFMTMVQPHARAGASFHIPRLSG